MNTFKRFLFTAVLLLTILSGALPGTAADEFVITRYWKGKEVYTTFTVTETAANKLQVIAHSPALRDRKNAVKVDYTGGMKALVKDISGTWCKHMFTKDWSRGEDAYELKINCKDIKLQATVRGDDSALGDFIVTSPQIATVLHKLTSQFQKDVRLVGDEGGDTGPAPVPAEKPKK